MLCKTLAICTPSHAEGRQFKPTGRGNLISPPISRISDAPVSARSASPVLGGSKAPVLGSHALESKSSNTPDYMQSGECKSKDLSKLIITKYINGSEEKLRSLFDVSFGWGEAMIRGDYSKSFSYAA